MNNYLDKIPGELKYLINQIKGIASKENLKAYLVGGFVRDLILDVRNLDLDIVVEGDGIKFAQDFAHSLGARFTPHRQFGTATVFAESFLKVDFSSARKEYYPKPAHLPVVSSGSLKDDLFRRDFTINAMAISLSDARLIDYFGGQADLKKKIIRVLHPLSFVDDPTRLLRAIRFEQRYSFKIEPYTLGLLKEAVKADLLELVHPHRLRDELVLILKEKNPIKEIRRLGKVIGFRFLSPGISVSKKTLLFLKSLENEIRWFGKRNSLRRLLDNWLIYLIGLLEPLSASQIKKICGEFGLRKGEEKRLLSYKQMKPSEFRELSRVKIKPSRIFSLLEPLSYETLIALRAKHKNPIFRSNLADFLEVYNGMRILVCGDDLRYLGLLPGPRYQKIFSQVLSAKLNGRVKTREEELSLIKELLRKKRS